jgi:hypothetical protein
LIDAIFGIQLKIKTIDNKDEILNLSSGWQSDEKLIFENRVRHYNFKKNYLDVLKNFNFEK